MSDEEFLRQVEAKEKLKSKGFKQKSCSDCKGTGIIHGGRTKCYKCDGKGYTWEAPLEK